MSLLFHLDYVVQKLIRRYKLEDKKSILSDIYQLDLFDKDERFVEIQFRKIMRREIRDIEKDIENFS